MQGFSCPPNNQAVIHCVDDAIRELGVDQFNLNLLRTDKASCMRKTANTLKQLHPGMFISPAYGISYITVQCI